MSGSFADRGAQYPLAQSLLFVGCASTWGLVFVLMSGMLLEPRLNPVDVAIFRAICRQRYSYHIGCVAAIMTLAAFASLISSVIIRLSSHPEKRSAVLRRLPFLHAATAGAFAYDLTASTLSSLNILSTRLPPPYHAILLDALVYTGHLMLPALVMLALSVLLLAGKPLSHYVRSSTILLYVIALVAGTSALDALLMLHLTPVMATFE